MSNEPRGRVAILALAVVGAVATVAYWVIWFFVNRDWLAASHAESYYLFENSFPLADGWMTICLALAALRLIQRRESALLWLLLGGSAALYLGCMDILFDLQNGIYCGTDAGAITVELLINVFCVAGGGVAMIWGWKHRRTLQDDRPLAAPAS